MSIKFYPLGNFPASSSFSVSSSLSETNLGEVFTTTASFAEITSTSIIPAPVGTSGRDIIIDARDRTVISLEEE